MKLPRRQFLHLAAGAAALPAVSRIARAQAYPSRPVRIIVGFPPAGSNDIHARLIAQLLSERLGQQFIVENRAGAGGSLATETVVRAARPAHDPGLRPQRSIEADPHSRLWSGRAGARRHRHGADRVAWADLDRPAGQPGLFRLRHQQGRHSADR
jgi:Tripartite tricarboxylate transporter family receptor